MYSSAPQVAIPPIQAKLKGKYSQSPKWRRLSAAEPFLPRSTRIRGAPAGTPSGPGIRLGLTDHPSPGGKEGRAPPTRRRPGGHDKPAIPQSATRWPNDPKRRRKVFSWKTSGSKGPSPYAEHKWEIARGKELGMEGGPASGLTKHRPCRTTANTSLCPKYLAPKREKRIDPPPRCNIRTCAPRPPR